jgi:hypothetical protein
MRDPLLEKLFDVVDECHIPPQEFLRVGFAFLALAISTLPAAERAAQLRAIEDDGTLRRAVARFPKSVLEWIH